MNRFPIFVAHVQVPPNGSFSQLHNAEREPLRPVALKVLEARPEALGMAVLWAAKMEDLPSNTTGWGPQNIAKWIYN
jgi:hypothetical protein